MKPLLTTAQVAALTSLSIGTLRKMRMSGNKSSIPWIKIGRRCAYRQEDIEAFVDARRHR